MATKKKKTSTGSRKRSTASPKASAAGKALAGKATRGEIWEPSQPDLAAAAAPEINEPRPYTSRYPIPDEKFRALKEAAAKAKLPKKTAETSKDTGKKKEVAMAIAAAPVEPGLAPVMAPTASSNFAGITATGWIPPDCTMAVGPQHVLASVNSSVALYNKMGGAQLWQRTLSQWFSNVVQGMTIFDPKA